MRFKIFGAEGFEPPTYWSQTSRASQTALCPDSFIFKGLDFIRSDYYLSSEKFFAIVMNEGNHAD